MNPFVTVDLSLIIKTYNRPEALRLVLEGGARKGVGGVLQAAQGGGVVGDDGYGGETERGGKEGGRGLISAVNSSDNKARLPAKHQPGSANCQ